jgi:hypothetical protein
MLRSVEPGPETPARKAHTEAFRAWIAARGADEAPARAAYLQARAAAIAERTGEPVEAAADRVAWRNALSRRSEP